MDVARDHNAVRAVNNPENRLYIQQVVAMLSQFRTATKLLEGDVTPTLALIVPVIQSLLLQLEAPEVSAFLNCLFPHQLLCFSRAMPIPHFQRCQRN
jgi:hypothetical protein